MACNSVVQRLHVMWRMTDAAHACLPALCLDRAKRVLELLKKEMELCKLQADIREQV